MTLTKREAALLRALSQRRLREADGSFLAEGVRVVEDLLLSPLEVRLLVHVSSLEDIDRGRDLLLRAGERGVRTCAVTEAALADFATTRHPQGVIAVARAPRTGMDALEPGPGASVLLLLDAVQDPGNFGTLVRTAEALGAAGVVTLPGTVDPWNPKSVRSAAGSSFRVPMVVGCDWERLGPWLRDRGYHLLASAADGEPLGEERPDRAALVVGNEGAGISAEARIRADRTVSVPLRGRAESLNVAAAAAILLFQLLR
jgi:RNA methyltransferase, TrmH family